MIEIERPFFVAKCFNTNLVQFLTPNHVIQNNMQVCSFTSTISHMYRRAPKTSWHVQNLVYKK